MKKVNDLFEFIERAVKSRKYPEATAQGLRAALKLFEAVLNDEERNSLDLFKNNLEQIYHSVSVKNGKDFTANSLAAYKSRVLKIINDFEKYGIDPTKMASWSPKIITRGPRKKSVPNQQGEDTFETAPSSPASAGMDKIELTLGSGKRFVAIVPMDITENECTRIKAVLDSMVMKTPKEN